MITWLALVCSSLVSQIGAAPYTDLNHFDAVADSPSSLLAALQNASVFTLGIKGHVDLDSVAFRAGNVVLDRPLTVSALPGHFAEWHFPDTNAQLTVGINQTLTLASFNIESLGRLPGTNDISVNQDSLVWPAIAETAGATVSLSDMILNSSSSCSAMQLRLPRAASQVGPASYIIAAYGSDVPMLQDERPVLSAFQQVDNSTWTCDESPAMSLQTDRTDLVTTPAELLHSLNDTQVTIILVNNSINIDSTTAASGMVYVNNRTVTIASAQGVSATIDFGNMCSLVWVTSSGGVEFVDVSLTGIPGPPACAQSDVRQKAYWPNWGYTAAPSILFDINSTSVHTRVSSWVANRICDQASVRNLSEKISASVGQKNVQYDNNRTIAVDGVHPFVVDLRTDKLASVAGQMLVQLGDVIITCVLDQDGMPGNQSQTLTGSPGEAPEPAPDDSIAGAAQNSRKETSSLPAWAVALIVLGSLGGVAAVLWGIVAWHIFRRVKHVSHSNSWRSSDALNDPVAMQLAAVDPLSSASSSHSSPDRQSRQASAANLGSTTDPHEHSGDLGAIIMGPLLGQGSYGRVYKGTWHHAVVAIKKITFQVLDGDQRAPLESVLSPTLSHPNIVHTYHISTATVKQLPAPLAPEKLEIYPCSEASISSRLTPPLPLRQRRVTLEMCMIMEYCDRGSLEHGIDCCWFHDAAGCQPNLLRMYQCLLDIACGADYLHSSGVIHGDLKPANVLLCTCGQMAQADGLQHSQHVPEGPSSMVTCKLADFGLSRILSDGASHLTTRTHGTVSYMPPELLCSGIMSRAADVYSFAMLMWELWTGKHLYNGVPAAQVSHQVAYEGRRPEIPHDCPPGYMRLMTSCWQATPAHRPTFKVVLEELQALRYDEEGGSSPEWTPPGMALHMVHKWNP